MLDAQATSLRASEFSISVSIDFSHTAQARSMHRLIGLFDGILRDIGEKTRSSSQSDDCEASIYTANFEFTLTRRSDTLNVTLTPTEHSEADHQTAQDVMTRLLRAAFPVIRPVRVHFHGEPSEVDLDQFMAGDGISKPKRPASRRGGSKGRHVRPAPIEVLRSEKVSTENALVATNPVMPSRVTRSKNAARPSASASRRPVVYGSTPNLPALVPELSEEEKRFQALRRATREEDAGVGADAYNLYQPEAPWRIILSWLMTGVTATQFLPAAAAIAALNVLKGTNLRINALAMSLTVAAVVLYNSGYATDAVAVLEPLVRKGSAQAIEVIRALLA